MWSDQKIKKLRKHNWRSNRVLLNSFYLKEKRTREILGDIMGEEMPRVLIRDQLPYGCAVNIHGQIVWRIIKEEHDAMKARVLSLFEDDDQDSHWLKYIFHLSYTYARQPEL